MTYACPGWELVADIYLLKLQHLQNKILRTLEIFPRCSPVRCLHTTFDLTYVYVYKSVQTTSRSCIRIVGINISQQDTRRKQRM
jgi:hypothetical protein